MKKSFPILITERLILRQLSLDDAQDIFVLRSDRDINKYLDRQPSKTIGDAEKFITNIIESIKRNESIYWVITLKESNTFAGTICLFNFIKGKSKCEIGYELLSQSQGKGIMKEAASEVIEYAMHVMKIQIIEAFTHKNNQSSTKLLEKLGFKRSSKPDKTDPNYHVFIFR